MRIANHRLIAEDGDNDVTFIDTPNQSAPIKPLYLIIHYTAGTSLDGAVSWFRNPAAQASAHLVIDRDGTIVQMVAFNKRAWHAGKSSWGELESMNQYAIGIELVNAGKLRQNGAGEWVNWSGKRIDPSEVIVATHPQESSSAGWQEYPEAQLEAAIAAGLALHVQYGFTDILGHEDVSPGRKVDPGPAFPMNSFRSRVLGRA